MKTCLKCGAQLPDDAIFCNSCGEKLPENDGQINLAKNDAPAEKTANSKAANNNTPNNDASVNVNPAPAPNPAPNNNVQADFPTNNETLNNAKKQTKQKLIGLVAVVLAVLILVILVASLILGSSSYKKPIKDLVNAVNKRSTKIESYAGSFLPSFGLTALNDTMKLVKSKAPDAYKEFDEELTDRINEMYEDLADTYGDNFKVSVEYKDAQKIEKDSREWNEIEDAWTNLYFMLEKAKIDDDDLYDDIADDLEDEYDVSFSDKDIDKMEKIGENLLDKVDTAKIEEAYKIKIKVTIKGSEDDDSEKIDFYVVKINGKWIIDPASNLGALTSYAIF